MRHIEIVSSNGLISAAKNNLVKRFIFFRCRLFLQTIYCCYWEKQTNHASKYISVINSKGAKLCATNKRKKKTNGRNGRTRTKKEKQKCVSLVRKKNHNKLYYWFVCSLAMRSDCYPYYSCFRTLFFHEEWKLLVLWLTNEKDKPRIRIYKNETKLRQLELLCGTFWVNLSLPTCDALRMCAEMMLGYKIDENGRHENWHRIKSIVYVVNGERHFKWCWSDGWEVRRT